jgi:hypothetical protein
MPLKSPATPPASSPSSPFTHRVFNWFQTLFDEPSGFIAETHEKRRLPRHKLCVDLQLRSQSYPCLVGETANVSPLGLFVELGHPPPPPGTAFKMTLGQNTPSSNLDEIIVVVVRTVRVPPFGVGLEILRGLTHPGALRNYRAQILSRLRNPSSSPFLT